MKEKISNIIESYRNYRKGLGWITDFDLWDIAKSVSFHTLPNTIVR